MPSRSRGEAKLEPPARKPGSRRIPIPSVDAVWWLAPLAVLSIVPVFAPEGAVLWKAYLAVLTALAGLDLLRGPERGVIQASRAAGGDYRVARRGAYTLRLENRGRSRLRVWTREVLPATFLPQEVMRSLWIDAGAAAEIEVDFLALERGRVEVPPATVRVRRPFGFFEWQESAGEPSEIVVYPGRPARETGLLLARASVLEDPGENVVRRLGHDRDFESLRDYVIGDDLRFVDWKATARRMKPQVRQFQMERNAEVVLAVDCGRLMGSLVRGVRKLDLAITSVLDLAAVAVQRRERVGLVAFDSDVLSFVPPRGGLRQVGLITDALARTSAEYRQASFSRAVAHLEAHHKKRSMIVVFTDFEGELSSKDLQAALAALSRRHVILFVAVGDPHLEDILEEEPRTAAAVYQKAAAAELVLERRRVLRNLNRAGVFTVDGDPRRLSGAVIKKYLTARGKL